MFHAIDISQYVINKSVTDNIPINNLKLQKLLYYIQAATLIQTGHPCFSDSIIAWQFGPAIPSVYKIYREYGLSGIPWQEAPTHIVFDKAQMRIIKQADQINLSAKDRHIVNRVITSYANVNDPMEVARKTCQENPWKNTCMNEEISCSSIKEYYTKHPEKIYAPKIWPSN